MLTDRWKNVIKVAVVCITVSLLSFILGARTASSPFYVFKKNPMETTLSGNKQPEPTEKIDDLEKLKPVADVMKIIKAKYVKDVNDSSLVEGAIRGMVQSLEDPYSIYMNPAEFEDFMISVNGSFEGVGISLGSDEKTGAVIVISPIEGTPAQKAGILPQDRIIKVDDVDIRGRSIDDVVRLLRGPKGTKVTLYIERPGIKNLLKFELVRDNIRLKTVAYEMLDKNIGYIKITSFDSYTSDEFNNAITELKKKGVKGLILDLRNNPGGSLYESVKVADRILGKGLVVYTEDRNKNKLEEYYSGESKLSIPLVVLVNENSASASEILAGAIQDYKAGILVGTKTFGKGSVQELEPFENGAGLKITIARYFIPSGRSIDGVGIQPNVKAELNKGLNPFLVPKEKDNQLAKALEILRASITAGR
ncbi:S41 family peptidase [Biomaibacter acetigenes]|jgi:carboxyl-terminal processing protease|uniref:S41 family peptidase n=1 Tax=Biomaibacter acetigenes TaxID=2316383 RepID=A0A3G2R730_9FIRM|nr:S41 family peptidase [Biomaibacter acetigenes]AYO31175.1 S41 family peptidase [Biomaibacter acetigenes]